MGSKRYSSQPSTRRGSFEDGGAFEKFELYVPKEAEVIVVPVEALPLSMRSRMSSVPSAKKADGGAAVSGRMATWISPVVIQMREARLGDSSGSQDDGLARARLHSAVAASAALMNCCWLPITCAHLAAFNVLRDFLPLGRGSHPRKERKAVHSEPTSLPPERILRFTRDSIIIHGGRIFLSIKNSTAALKRSHGRPVPIQDSSPLTVVQCQNNFRRSPGTRRNRKKPCATATSVQPCSMAGVNPQDAAALLQKFGISREVRVTLRRLPEIHRGCSSWQLGAVMDPNDQMLPSRGSSAEESGSCINVKDSKSESFQEHCAIFDQRDPVEDKHRVETEEQSTREPVLKKTRLSQPAMLGLHEGDGGDKTADGEEDGDVSRAGHGEEASALGQKEVTEDGQEEVAGAEDEDCVKHECDIKSEETVNWASHSPDGSPAGELPPYLVTSQLEDHTAFDFEQLARQERINRIREKIREKEAALRSLEPPS
ncbi:uncharacterized protein LOC125726702 isoform X2 [Brienomyrus brachyistius]|uniref:uncharacterized protein LOC125726702 isoform X2 n=1 Tax=Brienomyrus brachyistius TaxID=42636 RepID=UPI0020B2E84A|nr:uncharacterized protein LOC125726702 isoform X2 [Brienomyrus brachyistius]